MTDNPLSDHCLWFCHKRETVIVVSRDWTERDADTVDRLAGQQSVCSHHSGQYPQCGWYAPVEECPDAR